MKAPEDEAIRDEAPEPVVEAAPETQDVESRETANAGQDVAAAAHEAAAVGQISGRGTPAPWLLAGLDELGEFLQAAVEHYQAASGGEALSHAAEWLLDNAHLAYQAVREIREDMPAHFYRQLPVLTDGPLAGYPRIYDIAQRLIALSSARLDLDYARRFLQFYQGDERATDGGEDVAPGVTLTTGELWALPVMLRLGLVDRLARVLSSLTGVPAPPPLPALPLPASATPDELVGNCFISLRAIATHDWNRFFEAVSRVEAVLREDPAGIYAVLDRETRDQYRKAVEEVAAGSHRDEQDVAAVAVALARRAAAAQTSEKRSWLAPPQGHVGFYLVDAGLPQLKSALGYRASFGDRLSTAARRHPTPLYTGPILLLALLLVAAGLALGRAWGAAAWQQALIALLSIVPALTVAVSVVDWLVTLLAAPRVLPKLDLEEGIPTEFRTLVVVPALLSSEADIRSLLEQLEVYYLGNLDANLSFALLADPLDAAEKEMPEDRILLEQAWEGVRSLNARYSRDGQRPFSFFYRERRWNPSEGAWMAWERKRGKLHELNRWLRGARDTSFVAVEGPSDELRGVRYVITLDADTVLPRDHAQRLVAAIAHPLNRAEVDTATGRVVRGYGILQPRTEITPTSAGVSAFTRAFSGDIGLDLYSRAVSNVYQDLFGTGIYTGKGIYDVDAFECSLAGRVPENRLLSHDLFEGAHARVALVTDIVVYEDYPASYLGYIRRLSRWTRGDWQLLPWLLPGRAPSEDGAERKARSRGFSAIDIWKLIDNLRRSLLPFASLLFLAAAWLILPTGSTPAGALVWTLVVLAATAVPALLGALTPFMTGDKSALARSTRSLAEGLERWLLAVVFLAFEAVDLAAAIATTLFRVLITHHKLLEWTTAAETARRLASAGGRRTEWRAMRYGVAVSVLLAVLVLALQPGRFLVALPLIVGWLIAPEVAYRVSRRTVIEPEPLDADQERELQALARRTWLFFEHFVGPEDHWLPPDHFQEAPRGVAAPYTSPTNIGMLLLSTLAAYDLGYIGFPVMTARLQYTFETLAKLERQRGHFLNWYDTRSLEPLPPRYISTVDSGNLAASLVVLRQALAEIPAGRIMRWARWEGLVHTYSLLDSSIDYLASAGTDEAEALRLAIAHSKALILSVRERPDEWWNALDYAAGEGWQQVEAVLARIIERQGEAEYAGSMGPDRLRNLRLAIEAIRNQFFTLRRFINLLQPWLPKLGSPPVLFDDTGLPEVRACFAGLRATFETNPTLADQPEICRQALEAVACLQEEIQSVPGRSPEVAVAREWCDDLKASLVAAQSEGEGILKTLADLAAHSDDLFNAMDFGFLFDPLRQVFHIGFNVTAGKLDDNYYDLLASEARIASLIALAKHDVPRSHWLHLSRPLTEVDSNRCLLSWSATMFEYLMPRLLMCSTPGTLLAQSEAAAVEHQVRYGRRKGIPWGISESGYYAFDASQNYQYRAFGVPGLGFKRDLAEDLVVAPYASFLALPYRGAAAVENLRRLKDLGALGLHGFYEAVDFTRARLALGQQHAVVQEYMAHHQGMILVALANRLKGDCTVERFHADPRIRSVDLLLEEKVPQDVPLDIRDGENDAAVTAQPSTPEVSTVGLPWAVSYSGPAPAVHYLSNGRFGTLITAAGAGLSRWQGLDLTRWRPDTTLEQWGTWIYVRDEDESGPPPVEASTNGASPSAHLWSAAYQPTGVQPESESVHFYPHMADFRRTDRGISLQMEVLVAPDDDAEIRRLTVINESDRPRHLSLTSYAELVMATPDGDIRHPAFNKLFIQSELVSELAALLFKRRPRSDREAPVFVVHHLAGGTGGPVATSCESDRAAFIGRGRSVRAPIALSGETGDLGGAIGATLDPIMALQARLELQPGERRELWFVTSAAAERGAAVEIARRLSSAAAVENAFNQARDRAEVELGQLGLTTLDLQRTQALLAALLYPHGGLRAQPDVLAGNTKGQSGLWAYGISGDYPILLVRVRDEDDLPMVSDLLRSHTYWRRRQLKVDLVVLVDKEVGYSQELANELHRLLVRQQLETWINQRGGIFILYRPQLPEPDRTLLLSAARVVIDPEAGSLPMQVEALRRLPGYLPAFGPERSEGAGQGPLEPLPRPKDLQFDNGLGGFSPDGREYVVYLEPAPPLGAHTPAPWINVLANPEFGSIVSESGSSCTWAANSGENRLTPWFNDPVADPSGEALYLRDEETGEVWSPTPLPFPAPAPYLVRHGQGYSAFEHNSHGLRQRMTQFVAKDDPVKVVRLRVENTWPRPRRITATFYAEWVLGVTREAMSQYVIAEYDGDTQALLARNPYNAEFGERVAFAAASKRLHAATADRAEFLGRQGDRSAPAGLTRIGLAGTVRAGLDPCAALQVHLDLAAGESEEIWFLLGEGEDREAAVELAVRYKEAERVENAWSEITAFWDDLLTTVQVHTADPAMDLLLNRWLLYQALSCRIWGRSALYQSSGAYGFRDQLQDSLATVYAAPQVAREQILRSAEHQFEAGDVLHWWHPPSGRGVRTRCSDDLLWLPYVTAEYVAATGDAAILDETRPFLRAAPLNPDEEERYGQYQVTSEQYTLYEHCRRALEKGSTAGSHGLPLMGTGDWNDGMNRVGIEGRGESVWLGWFLHAALTRFAPHAEAKGDERAASAWRDRAEQLAKALDQNAWDGNWYLRAFYDDGAPLGSAADAECKIDAIAQSWAVLSSAGDPDKARRAMTAVREQLVRPKEQLVLLFTPPFDRTPRDPGYIKGYLPGIRENGGQYTHAATWTAWAFAALGEAGLAADLFALLNPINHADTPEKVERYKVEPYVIAADVYSVEPHTGRGGWTWYTGSSGWMYRLGLEGLLGLHRAGDALVFDPHLPTIWEGYTVDYRFGEALYRIRVHDRAANDQPHVVADGQESSGLTLTLSSENATHDVDVYLG